MPTKTWKHAELNIARWLKGKRRGADYRGENAGKSDIIKPGWSIEVKHLTKPTWSAIVNALLQTDRNRPEPGDIPIAVIHKAGDDYSKSIVVMFLDEFSKYFINGGETDDRTDSDNLPG